MTRKRIQLYEDRIDQYRQLIHTLELFRWQVDQQMNDELRRVKLIGRYDLLLDRYRQYVDQAQICQQQVVKKLSLVD